MKAKLLILSVIASGLVFAASPFLRAETEDTNATYLVGKIDVAPAFLVQRFGAPGEGDRLRVSGSYTFISRGIDPSAFKNWPLSEYRAWKGGLHR